MQTDLEIVWFKRDLRIHDHAPLLEASRHGPVLPLYVVEPELWRQPDASGRQWNFVRESLGDLRTALGRLGQPLVVRVGEVVEVLEAARRRHGIARLWSHQETGNGWTFARDRRVAAWAREHGIAWIEHPSCGVVRRLAGRDGWARQWEGRMAQAPWPAPDHLPALSGVDPGIVPSGQELGLAPDPCPGRQRGGRAAGRRLAAGFLGRRGREYARRISSPLTAPLACSRLSPHLAWGTLSLREVVRAARRRGGRGPFLERLHWHCHFIQKLEDQPSIEFRELHPATAGQAVADPERLQRWCRGETGLPFVDACMRALIATGWLNFRMRAMLMSVASHHLRLHWRDSGLHLARSFTDYEPGIHWSQCQMQCGTTGINIPRIYDPVKQGLDHDPAAVFLRRWLPELAGVPAVYLHQPWTMDPLTQRRAGCRIGHDYPAPIVDVAEAGRQARERLLEQRRQPGFAATAAAIRRRHGSRRSGPSRRSGASAGRRQGGHRGNGQLSLDLSAE